MTAETIHDAHAPTFAAPMEPARYTRRLFLEPHQLVERVTPQRDLFVLAHLGIPHVVAADWRLVIDGLVERSLTLTLDDLRRLPAREVESFHQCAGAPRRPDLAARRVGNVVWRGVDLADLLRGCGIADAAQFVWAYGLDHGKYEDISAKWYVKDLPRARLADGGVLLAYEVNGEPLAPEHGFPLRLIVPGYYGTNTVKWLWRLRLAPSRATGPFTTVLYNDPDPASGTRPVWEAPPESLIVAPRDGSLAAAPIAIWGWAWGAAGIAKVEISLDGGETWSLASLEPRRQWSWQRFSLNWQPSRAGAYTVAARATDLRGIVQPQAKARNSVHTVGVTIA
ncbi:MAG TPA: molybdopterin-dependent oxidoreductase [Xanthobacteraceae bacterium]|nr:molybdopterin-dependent oxidoreductase [Xanthobacteraceae bacterium]